MRSFFKRIFSKPVNEAVSASLPVQLLRDGWQPYRFPNHDVVIILPQSMHAIFDKNGVLYATSDRKTPDLTATLHTNDTFINQRELALKFVANLAVKKGAQVIDVGTYRYFSDPKIAVENSKENHFWIIGIPGAAVVISLSRAVGAPFPPALESILNAIPDIVGELL